MKTKIRETESDEWHHFSFDHQGLQVAQACLDNVYPEQSIAESNPDLVNQLHVQVRLMGKFGLKSGVP